MSELSSSLSWNVLWLVKRGVEAYDVRLSLFCSPKLFSFEARLTLLFVFTGLTHVLNMTVSYVERPRESAEDCCSGAFSSFPLFLLREAHALSSVLVPRCQLCPDAYCEDCLPAEDLDAVGDVLPEFLLLGYGKNAQAYFIRCAPCLQHFAENPDAYESWRKEQDKVENKARKEGHEF